MALTKNQMEILTNIIGAVESGGQIYGNRNYSAYAGAYANSSNEVTCTLGWAQNYGYNAMKLVKAIFESDKTAFRKADTANIEAKLNTDWVATKWNPDTSEKNALIKIITTDVGKKCQDELFQEAMKKSVNNALTFDSSMSVDSQMMWCEIEHLGGTSPTKRIFNRATKPYTVDTIYASLLLDQNDTSNSYQVGDKIFQSRHECCVKWIKQYVLGKTSTATTTKKTTINKGTTTMTEAELRSSVANFLVPYLGISEGSAKHKQLLAYFNNSGLCTRYTMTIYDAWCATAVSAAFIALGLAGTSGSGSLFECVECSCYYMVEKAKTQGIWVESDSYAPKVGDVIMYNWSDGGNYAYYDNSNVPDHVGIVTSSNGSTFSVIEGNNNNTVGYRAMNVNGRYTRGFITPNYAKFATSSTTTTTKKPTTTTTTKKVTTTTAKTTTTLSKGSTGDAVKEMQKMLIAVGYSCGSSGADGIFGDYTYNALVQFQKDYSLDVDGVYGNQSKTKLTEVYKQKQQGTSNTKVESAQYFDKSVAGTYVTTADLNMRSGAGTNKTILITIPKNKTAQCYGYYNMYNGVKWLYIVYDGIVGFASSRYLSKR